MGVILLYDQRTDEFGGDVGTGGFSDGDVRCCVNDGRAVGAYGGRLLLGGSGRRG